MMIVFLSAIFFWSILITIEPTNLKKSYSQISERHDQTLLKLNNIFNLIGYWSSNYIGLDEIKWLSASTKNAAQKFIAKP